MIFIFQHFSFYESLKFHAQLNEHEKSFLPRALAPRL